MYNIDNKKNFSKENTSQKEKNEKNKNKPKYYHIEELLVSQYDFCFDEILQVIFWKRKEEKEFNRLQDIGLGSILRFITHSGISCNTNDIRQIITSDILLMKNPVKDYFLAIEKNILDQDSIGKLSSFVVLRDDSEWNFFCQQLEKFMIRCVRSVFEASYYNRGVFVLVSPKENIGKSFFFEKVVPKPFRKKYYQTSYRLGNQVDALSGLASNFIINLEEVDQFTRTSDGAAIKSRISQSSIKVRLTHRKFDSELNRLASFVATSNDLSFLNMDLGYSRWIPFHVDSVKWLGDRSCEKSKSVDRLVDSAWQLALFKYKKNRNSGELDRNDLEIIKKKASSFIEVPVEQDLLTRFFLPSKKEEKGAIFLRTSEILEFLNQKVTFRFNAVKLGRVLRKNGFFRSCKRIDRHTCYGYWVKKLNPNNPLSESEGFSYPPAADDAEKIKRAEQHIGAISF